MTNQHPTAGSQTLDDIYPARVLTIKEASLVMRCSKAHLQSVLRGRVNNVPPLPCIRIGHRIVIRRESLERWMAAIESPAGARA
jgi:hypothetical protein